MELIKPGLRRYIGLSSETKPSSPPGSTFYEMDTGLMWLGLGGTDWVVKDSTPTSANVSTTIDLNQVAGAYTAFTATAQNVFIEFLGVYIPVDVSEVDDFTGISVQSTDDAPVVFLSSTAGAKANLTEGALLTYTGPAVVVATKLIQLSVIGGATGVACEATVFARYRPVVAGGYLA
jgi:hypothetical protein